MRPATGLPGHPSSMFRDCRHEETRGGGGGGVLLYFHTYVGSAFLGVQKSEFQYFLGFQKNEYFLGV